MSQDAATEAASKKTNDLWRAFYNEDSSKKESRAAPPKSGTKTRRGSRGGGGREKVGPPEKGVKEEKRGRSPDGPDKGQKKDKRDPDPDGPGPSGFQGRVLTDLFSMAVQALQTMK